VAAGQRAKSLPSHKILAVQIQGQRDYATFFAVFAVRTFSSLGEDSGRTGRDNYKHTRTVDVGFAEVRIVPQSAH